MRAQLEQWTQGNAGLLADIARPDLAVVLAAVVDTTGEPGARTLREAYAEATAIRVTQRRDRLAALAAQRAALADRRAEVAAERDRIAAEHDDAPPAPATRPAPRAGRPGAPLWRLVRFADGVTVPDAAAVEAALHAAGLLDAWLHPDPGTATAALAGDDLDGYLLPLPPHRRPTAPPLICTEGVPSVAVHTLLGAAHGAAIRWRNDFDWTGVRLTAAALQRYRGAVPWRMTAADYLPRAGTGTALIGTPTRTPWDESLGESMRRTGRAVMEERLLDLLIADLRVTGAGQRLAGVYQPAGCRGSNAAGPRIEHGCSRRSKERLLADRTCAG
ncbi:DUF2399 domain-containing protein [Micromonospora sp. NPDC051300]|uniref:DUF2399 domain-containing protein n=1 Tax=Micromonospora sp. NPDC051300 TaxID=3364286 RepID=UPI0037BC6E8D